MTLRPATERDRAAIAALQAASWQDSYRAMLSAAYLENQVLADLQRHWQAVTLGREDVVLIAEEAGEAVGFIAVWCDPAPYIDNLHVLPSQRSKGTGRKLMQAAARQLQSLGHSSAYLWVLEGNQGALRFYEGLGGRQSERADLDVFGRTLPSIKVAWSDLAVIAD